MRTNLGDQGSQVRVLSPRFAAHCTAVKPFPLDCSRFQLAGISHFAGTSTHSLIDVLSCKTTLSRAPSANDHHRDEADRLTGVELADGQVVARTAVFVRPGNLSHDDGLLAGLGCELRAGFPVMDATGLTSVSGVRAAGNVADPRAQVITSAGAGSAAAIAINVDLVLDDVERAVADFAGAPVSADMESHVSEVNSRVGRGSGGA
jgi:hypothetical protein